MKTLRCVLMIGLIATTAFAAIPQSTNPEQEQKAKLVNTMRLLNTQEYTYQHQEGHFATLDEMVKFLRASNALSRSPIDLENPQPYSVALTTTADGLHYQITLNRSTDMKDKSTWCQTAAFSDERGVIYLGVALGCEQPKQ